ncbi:DUF2793 domain-containing protein [Rhodobacteraceae bacterium NNCM2]|nr:DUF2793 domain-containing protein [Coraliihabitans acroporae]
MADTANLALPLLDAAQAQKHVTMNEALARVDALAFGAVASVGAAVPPTAIEGETHVVGQGATGDWQGHETEIAIASNGGWTFYAPRPGWQVWSLADNAFLVFDGQGWQGGVAAMSPGGAATVQRVMEFDHALSGAVSTTEEVIPDKASVLGITARVIEAIAGAASWSLGVAADPSRYGSGFGGALNSSAEGVTGQPVTYYGGEPLEVTAAGGSFTAGALRIAVHYQAVTPPRAV